MTVVLSLDEAVASLDRAINLSDLKNLIVVVRADETAHVSTPGVDAQAFDFDDDDLITWEDAEWQ